MSSQALPVPFKSSDTRGPVLLPPRPERTSGRIPLLRTVCASVALLLGGIQTWVTRFAMGPDGISYLDNGDAYWRGDWHHAVSAYWSPLYGWILGFFLKFLKPGLGLEYPLVHAVNFLIYAAALLCFEFFFKRFLASIKPKQTGTDRSSESFREGSWWVLGYAVFTSTSLLMIGTFRVCPDMCVAALTYLAFGLIIRIRVGEVKYSHYLLLGVVLGVSYLAKAVMFPLSFAFLAVAIAPKTKIRSNLKNQATALLAFLVISAPLVLLISRQQGKLTFGESGNWNYALYVNGMRYWETSAWLTHPVRAVLDSPPVFEFGEPIGGTYPPWYDPIYWHHGFKAKLAVHASLRQAWSAVRVYTGIFFVLLFGITAGVCLLLTKSTGGFLHAILRMARWWPIALPALACLAIYAPVHAESRFVAAPTAILLVIAYAGALPAVVWGQFTRLTMMFVCALTLLTVLFAPVVHWPLSDLVWAYPRPLPTGAEARAAEGLLRSGVHANDRIGLIWNEKWARGAIQGAFVARLARVKIVAEEVDADAFWKFDEDSRSNALHALQSIGIRAIVARNVPADCRTGWRRLGDTDYYMYPGAGSEEQTTVVRHR